MKKDIIFYQTTLSKIEQDKMHFQVRHQYPPASQAADRIKPLLTRLRPDV